MVDRLGHCWKFEEDVSEGIGARNDIEAARKLVTYLISDEKNPRELLAGFTTVNNDGRDVRSL